MDTTLEHPKAKELRQHEIRVAEIKRRAQTWRLMDCDEDTLRQMRDALIEEMEALEGRLAEADERFMVYVEKGLPLETQETLQFIERLSAEWEKLNKNLKVMPCWNAVCAPVWQTAWAVNNVFTIWMVPFLFRLLSP
jgi:hypothetical protein